MSLFGDIDEFLQIFSSKYFAKIKYSTIFASHLTKGHYCDAKFNMCENSSVVRAICENSSVGRAQPCHKEVGNEIQPWQGIDSKELLL